MEILPYNAEITYEKYKGAPRWEGECEVCDKTLQEGTFLVCVPHCRADGQEMASSYAAVCSKACALRWLDGYMPNPHVPWPAASGIYVNNRKRKKFPNPTETQQEGWIWVFNRDVDYPPEHPVRGGKWLVFLGHESADQYWRIIAEEVLKGNLGDTAKISTAKSAEKYGARHVVCVYTYDCADKDDAMRIRECLRACGIQRPIRYKTDIQTRLGLYDSNYSPIYCC